MLQLSVVVPVYSGAAYLESLAVELEKLQTDLVDADAPIHLVEAIFVDDAARDASPEVLTRLRDEYDFVQVVTMSRNFGQHGATIAGILHTTGDWVVSLDEDLQHPPSAIPDLLEQAVADHGDVVYAAPAGRAHSAYRDLASRIAKRVVAAISGSDQLRIASSFRVMRGPIARAAAATASHETYFDAALLWYTTRARRVELEINDERVLSGERSGYSLRHLISHARRMLTSGDLKVLRLIGGVGLVGVTAAAILGIRLLILWASGDLDRTAVGWPSTFSALLFFGGIITVQLVVLTEYAISSALHLRGKPTYFSVDRSSDRHLATFFSSRPRSGG
ncbi:MAG: glycosyltransferase [Acidimicrobiales bacterium]